MLVKVHPDYAGYFGARIGKSIKLKTNKDAPFEIDDTLADEHIRNGVLVVATAEDVPTLTGSSTEAEHRAVDNGTSKEGDWKTEAKAMGINIFGKKKAEVLKLIEEAKAAAGDVEENEEADEIEEVDDGEAPPELDAALPE